MDDAKLWYAVETTYDGAHVAFSQYVRFTSYAARALWLGKGGPDVRRSGVRSNAPEITRLKGIATWSYMDGISYARML